MQRALSLLPDDDDGLPPLLITTGEEDGGGENGSICNRNVSIIWNTPCPSSSSSSHAL